MQPLCLKNYCIFKFIYISETRKEKTKRSFVCESKLQSIFRNCHYSVKLKGEKHGRVQNVLRRPPSMLVSFCLGESVLKLRDNGRMWRIASSAGEKREWAMIIEWKRGKDSWSGSRTARGTWLSTYVIVLVIPST